MKKTYLFLIQTLVVLSLVFAVGCDKESDNGGSDGTIPGVNKPPTCSITNPQNNAQFSMDENILVTVVAEDSDGTIVEVQLYVNDVGHSSKTTFPYNFTISGGELKVGTNILKAVAKDNEGAKAESTISITIKLTEYKVGMSSQGGIIAYINNTGQHGLVAAPRDESGTYTWYQALTVCDELVLNGYSDWYLPSKDELSILYQNRSVIGGFIEANYWSSSEEGNNSSRNSAWYQNFSNGGQGFDNGNKNSPYRIRAIRAF